MASLRVQYCLTSANKGFTKDICREAPSYQNNDKANSNDNNTNQRQQNNGNNNDKNDQEDSGSTLRKKFNLIDI